MTSCLKSLARGHHLLDTSYSYKILIGFPSEKSFDNMFIITKLEFIGILIFVYAATLTTCGLLVVHSLAFDIFNPTWAEKDSRLGYHLQLDSPSFSTP